VKKARSNQNNYKTKRWKRLCTRRKSV